MTDLVLNAICSLLLLFITATVVICLLQCPDRRLARAYGAVGCCVFGWLLSVILYRIVADADLALFLDNLPFPFIAYLPVALFFVTLIFYHKEKWISKKLILLLSIVPTGTALIALIPALSFLLRQNHVVEALAPLHIASYTWNWWFYLHVIHSYLLLIASVVVVVTQHRKQPSGYALPSGLLVSSIFCSLFGNVIALTATFEIDMTMITSSFGIIILYIAIANNPSVEYLAIARKEIFSRLDNAVFVLDKQRQVVDTNAAADQWLDTIGFRGTSPYEFALVMNCLEEKGGIIKESLVRSNDRNILMRAGDELIVYLLAERNVNDKKDRTIGSYISLTDITQYNKLITQLEQAAELDPLTKISNRRVYEKQCAEMDVLENLPLSVMIADINGLKNVNDQLGHEYGDELLRVVANTLVRACPKNAIITRIGGDEFAMIVPECTNEGIYNLMAEVKELLRQEKNDLFIPSVALGCATKMSMEQDLKMLIREADKAMYQQKENDRRKRS